MRRLALLGEFVGDNSPRVAEKSWPRVDGHNQLPKVIPGIKFADGIEVLRSQAQAAAA